MKKLSKISAIVLVVAMMLTMVSFNAFAVDITAADASLTFKVKNAAGTEVTGVKAGTKVTLEVYITPGSYSLFNVDVAYFGTLDESGVTSSATDYSKVEGADKYGFAWYTPLAATADTPIAVLPITIPEDAADGSYKLAEIADFNIDGEGGTYPDPVTIEVSGVWDAKGYETIDDTNVNLGTSLEDAIAELPKTVTVKNEDGSKTEIRNVDEWTSATYNSNVADTYVFSGTIEPNDDALAKTDGFTVAANVVVNKLTYTIADIEKPYDMTGSDVTVDELKAKLPTTYTVTEGGFTEEVTIAWALNTEDEGTEGETISGADEYKNFIGTVTSSYFNISAVAGKVTLVNNVPEDKIVATINGVKYASLQEAVNAYKGTYDIRLYRDHTETEETLIDKPVRIHLNGHKHHGKIRVNKAAAQGASLLADEYVEITGNGELAGELIVETGSELKVTVESGNITADITGDVGSVVAEGGTFDADEINDGTNDAPVVLATTDHATTQVMADGTVTVYNTTDPATESITVELLPTATPGAFDIVLYPASGKLINEFVSAQLTFHNESETISGGKMLYTIVGTDAYVDENGNPIGTDADADAKIEAVLDLSEVNDNDNSDDAEDLDDQTWEFNVVGLENHEDNAAAASVKLGTIKFDGYGQVNLTVVAENENERGKTFVNTTTVDTNNEFKYLTTGSVDSANFLNIAEAVIDGINGAVEEIKRNVVVNVEFKNDITANVDVDYNKMEVSIEGEYPGFVKQTIALGDDNTAELATATFEDIHAGYRYTVTVKGAGYRTARYTTIVDALDANADGVVDSNDVGIQDDLVLNFWNNVKYEGSVVDPWKEIEVGVSGLYEKNFLAGDIAMDNIIDKYDLAAVVSYFGTYDLTAANEGATYVKYDLNRDGKIDSEDIAYVLYSIGE